MRSSKLTEGIAPGATITPINEAWVNDPQQKAVVETHIPMARARNGRRNGSSRRVSCF